MYFYVIIQIDDFANQVCVPLSGSPTKPWVAIKTTTEKPDQPKKYKDKDKLRVVLKVNQWHELDNKKAVAVDFINGKLIVVAVNKTKSLYILNF